MIETLTAPFALAFMQRAFFAAVIVGALCAAIGTFVVLRRLSFIGDGIAHASFAGIVISYMQHINYIIGAGTVAVLSACGIGVLQRRGIAPDSAIGVTFTSMFALGIFLMSRMNSYSVDLQGFLFGDILAVSYSDLAAISILACVVAAVFVFLYRALVYTSFDPVVAEASGIHAGYTAFTLLISLALTIVVSLQAVGIVLVAALLVTPAATASLVCRRVGSMLALSVALGVSCSVIGLYASYYLQAASGATIVLATSIAFLITLLLRGIFGRERAHAGADGI